MRQPTLITALMPSPTWLSFRLYYAVSYRAAIRSCRSLPARLVSRCVALPAEARLSDYYMYTS